jgi:hypothetical protein
MKWIRTVEAAVSAALEECRRHACHYRKTSEGLPLFFLAEFLESGIGAQRIPERIEAKKGRCNRC